LFAQSSGYTQTRYPIVLVHGMLGFDKLLGTLDYFHGIPADLRAGGAKVYTPNLSATNYTEVRGEQLIRYLDDVRAATGATKFNLIGHSHGGATSRYVASVRPDLVASITTVGAPHQGSKVADAIATVAPPGSPLRPLLVGFTNAVSVFVGFLSGSNNPQDALGALASLSTAGSVAFNQRHPQGAPSSACGQGAAVANGIRYFSMSGNSVATNFLDASDALLVASSLFFFGEDNDGLVSRCSSHWGVVLRDDYGWNHLDEANQIIGLRGLFASNPVSVYRAQANRLKNLGL
jgi:triacylglycerol lipase